MHPSVRRVQKTQCSFWTIRSFYCYRKRGQSRGHKTCSRRQMLSKSWKVNAIYILLWGYPWNSPDAWRILVLSFRGKRQILYNGGKQRLYATRRICNWLQLKKSYFLYIQRWRIRPYERRGCRRVIKWNSRQERWISPCMVVVNNKLLHLIVDKVVSNNSDLSAFTLHTRHISSEKAGVLIRYQNTYWNLNLMFHHEFRDNRKSFCV